MPHIPFLAGAATRKITPPLGERPVFLAGLGRGRQATAVQSDLYARALALRMGDQVAILVACDLIGLAGGDVDEIRAALAPRDIAPEALVVACTGTRSGPDTLGRWGADQAASAVDPVYMAAVKRAVAEAAVEALTFGCPVKMRAATAAMPGGYIAGQGGPGPIDDELVAIQLVRPNGETLATLLSLDCDPATLDPDSTLISADYAGAACRLIEQALGGLALHVTGALAGLPGLALAAHGSEGAAELGRAYAEAALAALAHQELAEVERLTFRRATFSLPLPNPPAAQKLAGLPASTCAYIDLGAVQIVTVPGELPPRLGRELKAALPGPARIVAGAADGDLGFILPGDAAASIGGLVVAAAKELANPKA